MTGDINKHDLSDIKKNWADGLAHWLTGTEPHANAAIRGDTMSVDGEIHLLRYPNHDKVEFLELIMFDSLQTD